MVSWYQLSRYLPFFSCLMSSSFFFRVINQRHQLFQILQGHGAAQLFHYLAADGAGGVLHHVVEGFVFPVDVGKKVLCGFWQIEDGPQIHHFTDGRCDVGKILGQQFQVFLVLLSSVFEKLFIKYVTPFVTIKVMDRISITFPLYADKPGRESDKLSHL